MLSQGCRYAPTLGLKLANAFGVMFKSVPQHLQDTEWTSNDAG